MSEHPQKKTEEAALKTKQSKSKKVTFMPQFQVTSKTDKKLPKNVQANASKPQLGNNLKLQTVGQLRVKQSLAKSKIPVAKKEQPLEVRKSLPVSKRIEELQPAEQPSKKSTLEVQVELDAAVNAAEKLNKKEDPKLLTKRAPVKNASMSRTTKSYFDKYLKGAFDLTTPEGIRQLEAHFFPEDNLPQSSTSTQSTSEEECQKDVKLKTAKSKNDPGSSLKLGREFLNFSYKPKSDRAHQKTAD